MFRYSVDEFIASKQQEKALILLEDLMKHAVLEHSPEIEKFFDEHVRSYDFLEELPSLSEKLGHPIVMVAIPWDSYSHRAQMDFKRAYDKLDKSWKDTVPFIEFSFPRDYNCKHGAEFMNVYIFFFNKFKQFEGSRDCTLYYLNKLNNLKAFL